VALGPPVATIAASRRIGAAPCRVYAFLADMSTHWSLGDGRLVLEELRPDGRGGSICVRGPVGLRRRVRARVTRLHAPSYVGGRATIGRRTRVHISWRVRREGANAVVDLTATAVRVGFFDRVLLMLGGRRWLRARFGEVLARLAAELEAPHRHEASRRRSV